jgi:D-hydroxyproline dehydrogenase subunit beta
VGAIGGQRPDAVVIGAGIVGAACAHALSRDGLRVLILESEFAGSGTTAAAMGHVVVMDDSEAQFALTAGSRGLWEELAPELSPGCEDEACGTLWLAADEEEMAVVREKEASHRRRGVRVEVLDGPELSEAEPNLRPGLAGALRVPDDRVIYPPGAARWLVDRARGLGARLREGATVEAIGPRRVTCGGEAIDTDVVVNAAGGDAARLTPGLPIQPRKGHLVITDRYPGFCRHELVELGYLKSAHTLGAESVAFNVQPRATGQLLVGSSREFVGRDASINRRVRDRMLRRAVSFLPALAGLAALRTWVGFRPATPDKLPLIGAWPDVPGLWIAAGHEGLGVTTALATARLLADQIAGRPSPLDPAPFLPTRSMPGAPHG